MHLNKLPKYTPPLSLMLSDLGNPHPRHIAKALGVSTRTVYLWLSRDEAPRPASLALFWLTRWGQQWLDADLFNLSTAAQGHAAALARQLASQASPEPASAQEKGARVGRPLLHVVR